MRQTTTATNNAWLSGGYVAGNKVAQRATIQVLNVLLVPYDIRYRYNVGVSGKGDFSCVPFAQPATPRELPNLKSIKWDRNVDQDVATCSIEMFNVRPLPPGTAAPNDEDFDQPGFYTFNRGGTVGASRWGYDPNSWSNLIVPDRVIRTFEGYGADYTVPPETDPHMYPSGVWLIDEVNLGLDGVLTVECRDIGRVLIDLISLPPVIPLGRYPVTWTRWHDVKNDDDIDVDDADWFRPTYETDSNIAYIARPDITDGGESYVGPRGGVNGHDGRDAFDPTNSTYFLSVGNRQKWSSAYEYVQGKFSSRTVAAVRVRPWAGPYTMYISVWAGPSGSREWKGKAKIPYRFRVVDTNADIPFVKAITIHSDQTTVVKLPHPIANATKVRVTFSNLYDSGIGVNYRYRAGVRDVEVSAYANASNNHKTHIEGDYQDYTDIIKYLCAWAGFYWPTLASRAFFTYSDGSRHLRLGVRDKVLPKGGVWGNFEQTRKSGPGMLTADLFDKKPLMDAVHEVKDIVGFNFYIDETGGVVWRQPNIWSVGNEIYPVHGGPQTVPRTSSLIVIDEEQTLMELGVSVSSRNVRELIFVGNATGEKGAVAAGYNPVKSGLRRVGGWTDQHFGDGTDHNNNSDECQIMADLITVRQMFTYRTNSVTIPGNPAIQIDDQVRIYERVTGETFIHYITGISSEWDSQTGQWTYQLTTHWLGETPFTDWSFDPAQLSAATKYYLKVIGKM